MSKKQILIVEDNATNREILQGILSNDYLVKEAGNGREALEILHREPEAIALILLDVLMPVMDGYDFLDRIKADPELKLIPVIVMTQSDSEEDELSALSHGAADFVPKPYRTQVILHRIASIIHLRETAAMVNQIQYDRLTGNYSKEFFYQKVRDLLLQNPEKQYDILCINIENFKLFNDLFGVSAGDRLLKEIASLGREMAGEHGINGRRGADRFMCFLERGLAYSDELFEQMEMKLNALSKTNSNVVLKWGIYRIEDRSIPIEQMCDRAFLAADSIKGQYRKWFAFYDEALRRKLLREQAITDAMETALAEGQFFVYFQPKYRLEDDCLAGAEALIRWNHPEWGFLSPGEFIPLFEKNGFITQLDQFVWERTCEHLREWREKGYPTLPVSVNVSRADVYQADLADVLLEIVEKNHLAPADLHLEITESAYTENPAQIISMVNQLRNLGFVIEMDDFGSGYSSLNMLNQMKLDILKLDMKFIQSETAKPVDQGILRFIVNLARWMNLGVVAEGVESREQLERLREIGCDYVQGYFFSKPMPSQEFERLLQKQPVAASGREFHPISRMAGQKYLLVVDEDPGYREMVRSQFGQSYLVLEADSAESALEYISNEKKKISTIILSMTLPEQGSFTVLKRLGENQTAWRVPVLATGPQDAALEEKALQLDADDYAGKPHASYSLKKRVARLLGLTVYQERERQLQDEAYRDFLTGLFNRRGLEAALSGIRQEDFPIAFYMFDLDNLKVVNDNYGHESGDYVLKAFSELIRRQTRDGDILSRYGGDEFLVVLKKIPSSEVARNKGSIICQSFRALQLPNHLPTSCSAGVVLCGEDELILKKLLVQADEALYQAKKESKGGCCLWQEK